MRIRSSRDDPPDAGGEVAGAVFGGGELSGEEVALCGWGAAGAASVWTGRAGASVRGRGVTPIFFGAAADTGSGAEAGGCIVAAVVGMAAGAGAAGAGIATEGVATGTVCTTAASAGAARRTLWAGTVVATVNPMAVVASHATATPNQPTPRALTTGSHS